MILCLLAHVEGKPQGDQDPFCKRRSESRLGWSLFAKKSPRGPQYFDPAHVYWAAGGGQEGRP